MAVFDNPIVPGFAPDPSAVHVDGIFYLATSSFHLFPGIPIYASIDLQNWTHIGNAINRSKQLSLENATTASMPLDDGNVMVASGGLFAPTIRYREGTFYIVCTNCYHGKDNWKTDNFLITTRDIWSDAWSDPMYFPFYGIDPSLFFDDDGRAYIQGSWMIDRMKQPSCTIKQFEIDINTAKPLSETREIWTGYAKRDTEGPHIYLKDGWYYLLVAEGGTFEHHMLSIARAKNVWGPYESCPQNPIMTSDGTKEPLQNVGHGEIFQDTNDNWWAAVLGVQDSSGKQPMGRESFLTPVDWPKDGWPVVQQPRLSFTTSRPAQKTFATAAFLKKVRSVKHTVGDAYLHHPLGYNPYISPSTISLEPTSSSLSAITDVAMLTRRQRSATCTATTFVLLPSDHTEATTAGLTIYKDPLRHASIAVNLSTRLVSVDFVDTSSKYKHTVAHPQRIPNDVGAVELRITADKHQYGFDFRAEGEVDWITLGKLDALRLTARDFTGTVFGVYAVGDGDGKAKVRFEGFDLREDRDGCVNGNGNANGD